MELLIKKRVLKTSENPEIQKISGFLVYLGGKKASDVKWVK